jgi:pseudouridine kinase
LARPEDSKRRAAPLRGVSHVAVVGGANVDVKVTIRGATVPATSNPGSAAVSLGGVGRNIAENLARLGQPVALIGAVGHDAEGERLLQETAATGVDVQAVARSARHPTGIYSAVLDRSGELVIGVSAMDVMDEITVRFLERRRRVIAAAAFIVADCNLPRASLQWLQQCAKQAGIGLLIEPVSVPKCERLKAILRRGAAIHTITPNRQQLAALTGRALGDTDDLRMAAKSLHGRGVENVLLGLGPEGALLSSGQGGAVRQFRIPAATAKPVDVTGGGDAHVAGYVAGVLQGMTPLQAALLGQAAAGLAVGARETVSRSMAMDKLTRGLAALKRRVEEI